jgi:hypothetical protein
VRRLTGAIISKTEFDASCANWLFKEQDEKG